MKIEELLRKIASDETIPAIRRWKVESATRWQIDGATEPEESGGAKLSYEDTAGTWRYFADLELSPDYGLSGWVDRVIVDTDVPAWLVMPFLNLFKHSGLTIAVASPVTDIPF